MKKIAVIKGDGVGPELMEAAMKVIESLSLGFDVEWMECEAGEEWWRKHGCPPEGLIPDDSWDILEDADACLKGPTTTPGGEGSPKSVAVSIRQHFDLYANVRPIKTFPNTKRPLGDVDFLCIREATEGFYFAEEIEINNDTIISIRRITRSKSRRIARFAFEEAVRRKWSAVVAIHKSNILKKTCGAFIDECRKVKEEYPDVELLEYHIDNIAQQLIKNPQIFNHKILLSTNLFMDIISEECAALVGSVGMIPTANIGENYAMFEPMHGSAPKYAGMDKVNPSAMILAGAWLIEYLGDARSADRIRKAVESVIVDGERVTYDLGGKAKLSEMTDAIIEKLQASA